MSDEQQVDNSDSSANGGLDVSTRSARTMLCHAVNSGWPITDGVKGRTVQALLIGLQDAVRRNHARDIASITRTIATLNGQNQADQHLAIKHQADLEARDIELPDNAGNFTIRFPSRGPQSADAGDDDPDREADDG